MRPALWEGEPLVSWLNLNQEGLRDGVSPPWCRPQHPLRWHWRGRCPPHTGPPAWRHPSEELGPEAELDSNR